MILRRAASLVAALLLAACGTPSPAPDGEPPALRPLARQTPVPPGAPPRSTVASVLYDLGRSGTGELRPDDGVPGDDGTRDVYQRGGASWYGLAFHNRRTASGDRFDMGALTAAHRTLPFGTRVCVRSLVNGKEVLVRINDRGPYAAGRIIDLSQAAAEAIDMVGLGIKQVALSLLEREGGRCAGTAVGEPGEATVAAPPAAPARRPAPTRRKRR